MMELNQNKITSKISVIKAKGRVDAVSAPELEKALIEALFESGSGLILDLKEVDYMSSAGIRVLVLGTKMAASASGLFIVCSLQESVKRVLEIVGFLPLLDVYADESSSIEAARNRLV